METTNWNEVIRALVDCFFENNRRKAFQLLEGERATLWLSPFSEQQLKRFHLAWNCLEGVVRPAEEAKKREAFFQEYRQELAQLELKTMLTEEELYWKQILEQNLQDEEERTQWEIMHVLSCEWKYIPHAYKILAELMEIRESDEMMSENTSNMVKYFEKHSYIRPEPIPFYEKKKRSSRRNDS
jgi:hypothetical protein